MNNNPSQEEHQDPSPIIISILYPPTIIFHDPSQEMSSSAIATAISSSSYAHSKSHLQPPTSPPQQPEPTPEDLSSSPNLERGRKRRRSSLAAYAQTTQLPSTTLRGRGRRRSSSINPSQEEQRHRSNSPDRTLYSYPSEKTVGQDALLSVGNEKPSLKKRRSQSPSRSRGDAKPRRRQRTRSRSRGMGKENRGFEGFAKSGDGVDGNDLKEGGVEEEGEDDVAVED